MATRQEIALQKQKVKKLLAPILRNMRKAATQGFRRRIEGAVNSRMNAEGTMEKIMDNRFKAESAHAPGGPGWKPLTPAYVRQRVRQGFGPGPILQRTGKLKRAAKAAVAGTFRLSGAINWDSFTTGVSYAGYVAQMRPFMELPNKLEMAPVIARAKLVMDQEIGRVINGR